MAEADRNREAWLEELAQARDDTRHSHRYSAFVSIAKLALPVIAVGVVGAIALWPTIEDIGRQEIGLARLDINDLERSPMLNALFQSIDDEERPFRVAAISATPSSAGEDLVELDRPNGLLRLDDGDDLSVAAEAGLFDRANRQLELFGDVRLRSADGHELRTELASVDFTRGSAEGATDVDGAGPSGALASQGFYVVDGGAVIVFTGPARALLTPAAAE